MLDLSLTTHRPDSSHVIDHLKGVTPNPKHVVTFVYFDYQKIDAKPARTLTVSLLRQIIRQLWPDLPNVCKQWVKRATQIHNLNYADLEDNLLSVLPQLERCYIVVDALDESGSADERMGLLALLGKLAAIASVRLCVTSRTGIDDIELSLQDAKKVQVAADKGDLKTCLGAMINRSSSARWIRTRDRDSMVDLIVQRSHGMSVNLKAGTAFQVLTNSIRSQVPLARAAPQASAE